MTTPNNQGADSNAIPPSQQSQGNPQPKDLPRTKAEAEALDRTDDEEHGTPLPKDDAKAKEEAAKLAAAKEAEEKKKAEEEGAGDEDEPPADDESWKNQYVELEGPGQAVIELLKEKGVTPVESNAIFAAALASGDLKDVKWDVLEARLGKASAALAKKGIEDYYEGIYKANVASRDAVHEAVGGDKNWAKLTAWAKKNEVGNPKLKAEVDEIRKGLDLGGRYAKQAAIDLKALYEADTNNKGLGTAKIKQGERTPDTGGVTAISRKAYIEGMHALNAKGATAEEYAALRASRQAGMAKGI